MRYLVFHLFIVCLLCTCEKDEKSDMNLITINLITNINPEFFKKSVVLYESDHYLVKTSFDTYINAYPFNVLGGYEEIRNRALSDTCETDTLVMINYLRKENDAVYILAYHLENGSCMIIDKTTNSWIESIQMKPYKEGKPMQSTAGRRFYIKGKLFLETVDLIS